MYVTHVAHTLLFFRGTALFLKAVDDGLKNQNQGVSELTNCSIIG